MKTGMQARHTLSPGIVIFLVQQKLTNIEQNFKYLRSRGDLKTDWPFSPSVLVTSTVS